jgi:multidrug efflux pump subunit AcrB
MRKIIAYFVKYPIIANIVIAVTLIAGIAALLNTKKSFFPELNETNIAIRVSYPGASPQEMEEGVTLKIEQAIKTISGIDEITSTSSENSARINILTLTNYDIDEIFTEVKNAVDGINGFPVSAERPVMYKVKPTIPAAWLSVTGDVSLFTLKEKAELIENDLLASGVISKVVLMGFPPREISIEVPEDNLLRYGLTFDEVAAAVRQNNSDISAGSIKSIDEEILIRSKGKRSEADKIGGIVLRSNESGQGLLLKDVATIREQFAESAGKLTFNGEPSVLLRVDKLSEEDLEQISAFIKQYAVDYNQSGESVHLEVAFDFMDILVQRLNMLQGNGLLGIVLVIIALGMFLSLRLSLWVAWGIPSSFLGMFILGSFFGLTINMISLFGMIIVIGILVDDGIVIAENIYTHFQKTKNPYKAAIDGTMEVLPAVTTSVLTTIIAFTPLLLIQGNLNFLSDMAFVVVASLGFSLIEAFFVLPAHLGSKSVLKVKKENTRSYKIRKALNEVIDFMRFKLYGNTLKYTMKYRGVSIAFLIALFPITMGLFQGGFIKATFFPNVPNPNFQINVDLKPGQRESQVSEYLQRFEAAVWEVNDDLKDQFNDSEDFIDFTLNVTGGSQWSNGSHGGQIFVFHRELDGSTVSDTELVEMVREKIGDVQEAERFAVGGQGQFGKPVAVRLLGQNIDQLNQARDYLKEELRQMSDLKEVQDDEEIGRRELLLDLTPRAYFLGLTHGELTKQIRQGFFGEEVQRLQKGNDEVRVWVRYPGSDRLSLGQVENMKVKTPAGSEYPLQELASFNIERGVSGIRHYDTNRSITVDAELANDEADLPAIMGNIREEIIPAMLAQYPGVKVDYGGQSRANSQAQQQMLTYFGIAVIFIFFVIMINFRSYYQAVLIMLMIPLGWLGAMFGHGIQGIPVSLLSAWGMIALSGIIINDAVVFLAKFNSLVKNEKMSVYQAAYHAGLARFRAIMLTSITTCAGLFPLLLETSTQAQIVIPMAVSVAYGVLIGTFIILLFFPVLIVGFNDVRRYAKWFWEGKKPTAEDVERVLIDERREEELKKIA